MRSFLLQRSGRVPPAPSWYPFAWLVSIAAVSEDDLLRMVGMDAYMMIRYLNICCRVSMFMSFFGVIIMVPVYATAPGTFIAWNKYTLANVPNNAEAIHLWVPVVFSYLFAAYYCFLFRREYRNFMRKRLQYLVQGDPDTPPQTYYTVMLERLPLSLQSSSQLLAFFQKLFPGEL